MQTFTPSENLFFHVEKLKFSTGRRFSSEKC